jgi:EmrB/QacA subfamily drug resistance transporter
MPATAGEPRRDTGDREVLHVSHTDVDVAVSAVAVEPPTEPLTALRSPAGTALIATTVLASMVGFLDAYVINVAVPAIGHDLHASLSSLQWLLSGYLVTVAALLLLSGALADRFGRRRVLAAGLVVMFAASVLCAVAPSAGVLIAARVVQGAGAAMVVPSSLALLNGSLRVADRARGIGVWAGLSTIGTTVGPYAGGWLVDHASWRAVFLLNLPLILAALIPLRHVPEPRGAGRSLAIDVLGGVLAVVGLGGVVYALTAASKSSWTSGTILASALVGIAALAALVPVERRRAAPMLRLGLFASRQFDAINWTTLLFYGALSAAGYLVILQCELRLGYSATQAGAALIPESVVFLLLAPVSGALLARLGPRRLMAAGILLVAGGFAWLSQAHPGQGYAAAILPGALLWGLGIGIAVTPLTAAVLAAVGDADLGEASAINDASSRVGGVVAIALVPALIGATGGTQLADALHAGYEPAMLAVGGVCVLAALVTALFVSDAGAPAVGLLPHPRTQSCALPVPAATARSSP